MGPKRFKRTTRRMVFKRYDSIIKSVRVIENAYGVKRIPLTTLKGIIALAYFEKPTNKDLEPFTKNFNKTLDSILMFSEDNSKLIGDKCISRRELTQWIDALKDGFIKGQNPKIKDQYYDKD